MSPDADVSARLADALCPLDTADPAASGPGLRELGDRLADHRVVGLGEATHGTREFFQFKHRIVRHLVEDHGFRLFGIEASFGETLAVDDYVRRGDGDPGDVVEGMGFWTWNTEEVLALVEWLREFNDGRARDDQVKFYGFDAQFVGGSAERIDDYLADAAPDLHARVADDLAALADERRIEDEIDAQLRTVDRVTGVLADELDARRDALVAASGERDCRVARQHATAIEQAAEFSRAQHEADDEFSGDGIRLRDRAMADNVDWILDHEPHDSIALWAHNAHLKRGSSYYPELDARVDQTGGHLADRYGSDYYALAFDFHHGSFQAVGDLSEDEAGDRESSTSDGDRGLREFTIEGAPGDALASALADAGHEYAFLDADTARDAGLGDWLGDGSRVRTIGALYDHDDADEHWDDVAIGDDFDGVLCVEETTRARPLG